MQSIGADTPNTMSSTATTGLSFPDGRCLSFDLNGDLLTLTEHDAISAWRVRTHDELALETVAPAPSHAGHAHRLAALEIVFNQHPREQRITLIDASVGESLDTSLRTGVLQREGSALIARRDLLWQQPNLWLPETSPAFPLRHTISDGKRHPLRPPKPCGVVYRRHIPWLGRTLSFRTIEIDNDLGLFNRWMNDPVVAFFWQEEGDLGKHRNYLNAIANDARVLGLIGCFDDEPFGYFEVYWAREDRIAPFYEARDYDRGWHVLIGEERFRGKPYLTAWMPSISHYQFLDDCRTQRIVIEPRIDNQKMLNSLARCGYAHLKAFDFPHKRAMLGMLSRERFFAEARWIPRADGNLFS